MDNRVKKEDKNIAENDPFEYKFLKVDGIYVKFNHCQKCGKFHIDKQSVAPDKLINIEKLICERIKKLEADLKIKQEGPEMITFVCSQGFPYSLSYNPKYNGNFNAKKLVLPA
uniref:Uncharacterized protein n=1 Tax=Panagrolaimus sp. ES5 TaxID=591445 RepID=A0AC34F5C6_9BILA